jgi:hypothetical protein
VKASDYRRQFDAELERATTQRAASAQRADRAESVTDLLAELTNKRYGAKRRTDAVVRAGARAVKRPRLMGALIGLVADAEENAEVRRAALSAIEATSFKTVEFRRYAPEFKEALRVAATDADVGLRTTALDVLALHKDPYAQQLLVDGLRDPRAALVRPVQAVRMLGYDVHAEHYPMLRDIVATSKQPTLRRAALRLLAADSGSRALMRRIASDKSEDKEARSTAAVALQSLAPTDFAKVARSVVLDDDEDDDVRATVISAITHGPTAPGREVDRKVREIDAAPGGPRQLNRAAREFTTARSTRRTRP